MQIYGDHQSGNCYKVAWVLHHFNLQHQWLDIDILACETQQPPSTALNPNAKIPLLVLDDGRCLSESNAIINYLAAATELLPSDSYLHAKVLQWQFFEQYSYEPYISTARFINRYLGLPEERRAEYASKQQGGHRALAVMEQQLRCSRYLVGEQLTLADISLYAYTHVAEEGGFDLAGYPQLCRWLEEIASQPNHLPMAAS